MDNYKWLHSNKLQISIINYSLRPKISVAGLVQLGTEGVLFSCCLSLKLYVMINWKIRASAVVFLYRTSLQFVIDVSSVDWTLVFTSCSCTCNAEERRPDSLEWNWAYILHRREARAPALPRSSLAPTSSATQGSDGAAAQDTLGGGVRLDGDSEERHPDWLEWNWPYIV